MVNNVINVSIITPSFNMLPYLKLCVASVRDQGVQSFEHIIIDGGSTDGTIEWLKQQKDIIWISEKDNGMYQALNKGIKIARGNLIGHLNCDEQYLPNTLYYVQSFIDNSLNIDFIIGHTVVIDKRFELIALKKAMPLNKNLISYNNLYIFTASMFVKRHIYEVINYNERYKSISDELFVLDMLKLKFKYKIINKYLAAYVLHDFNTSYNTEIVRNDLINAGIYHNNTIAYKYKKFVYRHFYLFKKIISGCYFEKTFSEYSIYTNDIKKRKSIYIEKKKYFTKKYVGNKHSH